jgi:hypothetical protein
MLSALKDAERAGGRAVGVEGESTSAEEGADAVLCCCSSGGGDDCECWEVAIRGRDNWFTWDCVCQVISLKGGDWIGKARSRCATIGRCIANIERGWCEGVEAEAEAEAEVKP